MSLRHWLAIPLGAVCRGKEAHGTSKSLRLLGPRQSSAFKITKPDAHGYLKSGNGLEENYRGHRCVRVLGLSGFQLERLKQITPDYEAVMSKSIFFKPTNFEGHKEIFSKLKEVEEENIGLVILDSVAMLYRLEMGKSKDVYNVNKELGIQLSYLSEIARKKNIPVVVTNQVYSDFDNKDKVRMVGGDLLKYSSKCLIELQKVNGARTAILKKHRSLPDGKQIFFKIINEGIKKVEEKN